MLAGSLSYFSMMALVPLCLFLIAVFGHILGHFEGFNDFFTERLVSFFPQITRGITKEIGNLVAFSGIGSLSVLLYGILSFQLFSSIENALNVIFEVKKRRTFIWSVILSLIVMMLLIGLLLVSFIATSLVPLLRALKPVFPEIRFGMLTVLLIQYVIPFLMVFFATGAMYIFFPRMSIRISDAFMGALFSAVFMEIAKHVFTWYVGTVMKLGSIYGSLTAFVVLLLWVFYSSCIFLIGAELVHNLGIRPKPARRK
jgi:membrane protein